MTEPIKPATPPRAGEAMPMTDARLACIRQVYGWARHDTPREVTLAVRDLLDEVVRLRNQPSAGDEIARLKAREVELVAALESINDENIGRMGW